MTPLQRIDRSSRSVQTALDQMGETPDRRELIKVCLKIAELAQDIEDLVIHSGERVGRNKEILEGIRLEISSLNQFITMLHRNDPLLGTIDRAKVYGIIEGIIEPFGSIFEGAIRIEMDLSSYTDP